MAYNILKPSGRTHGKFYFPRTAKKKEQKQRQNKKNSPVKDVILQHKLSLTCWPKKKEKQQIINVHTHSSRAMGI